MYAGQIGTIATAALDAAVSIIDAFGEAPHDHRVGVPAGDLVKVARMLQQLAVATREPGGMTDPDGFRFWVPMPVMSALQEELKALRGGEPAGPKGFSPAPR